MCTCTHVSADACMQAHISTRTHLNARHTPLLMHVCLHMCILAYSHKHTFTYTYMLMHTHTEVHISCTYSQTLGLALPLAAWRLGDTRGMSTLQIVPGSGFAKPTCVCPHCRAAHASFPVAMSTLAWQLHMFGTMVSGAYQRVL